MHGNPVQRGLVSSPDQWPWSSFGFYHLQDSFLLSLDRLARFRALFSPISELNLCAPSRP